MDFNQIYFNRYFWLYAMLVNVNRRNKLHWKATTLGWSLLFPILHIGGPFYLLALAEFRYDIMGALIIFPILFAIVAIIYFQTVLLFGRSKLQWLMVARRSNYRQIILADSLYIAGILVAIFALS